VTLRLLVTILSKVDFSGDQIEEMIQSHEGPSAIELVDAQCQGFVVLLMHLARKHLELPHQQLRALIDPQQTVILSLAQVHDLSERIRRNSVESQTELLLAWVCRVRAVSAGQVVQMGIRNARRRHPPVAHRRSELRVVGLFIDSTIFAFNVKQDDTTIRRLQAAYKP